MEESGRRVPSKWWLFAGLLLLAVVLNVSLYFKVALYGP